MMDINVEDFLKEFIIDCICLIKHKSDNFAKSRVSKDGFTLPQINVMRELVTEDGLSLKELSKRLNLSHSTVSGIIDRLEIRGSVVRKQDISDGRFTQIFISEQTNNHIKDKIKQMYSPFVDTIEKAQPDERVKILEGFSIFCRLLKESK